MDDYFDNVDSTEINLKYFTEHHESIYRPMRNTVS